MPTLVNFAADQAGSFGSTPIAIAFGFSSTPGNKLYAYIYRNLSSTGITIRDQQGNAYTLRNTPASDPFGGAWYELPSHATPQTGLVYHWTSGGSELPVLDIWEWSDTDAFSSAFDDADSSYSTSPQTGILNPSANMVVMGRIGIDNPQTMAAVGPGVVIDPTGAVVGATWLRSPDLGTSGANPTVGATISGNASWWMHGIVVEAVSGGADVSAVAADTVTFSDSAVAALGALTAQAAFRAYNDDGDEDSSTAAGAQDADISLAPDTPVRLRFGINTTGDAPSGQDTLQFRKVGDPDWKTVH